MEQMNLLAKQKYRHSWDELEDWDLCTYTIDTRYKMKN